MRATEMMAIGDNWNDVSMLELAGWPVLMANAPEALKDIAEVHGWQITERNDEDGVAKAIEHLLRPGEIGAAAFEAVAGSSVR